MQESNAFVLLNDEQNPLTSGILRKPLTSCFSDAEDEYQFEHKEYLISVEKGSLAKDAKSEPPSLPQPKRPLRSFKRPHVGRLVPINKEANPSPDDTELIRPRSKEEQETVDLLDLLAPKKVDRNVSSQDINSLLSLLESPVASNTEPLVDMTLDNPPSTPSLLSTASSKPRTHSVANDTQRKPSNLCTPVSLPTRRAIQSKDYSYFAFSKPAFSTLQSYQDYQEAAMKSLIRHLVFQTIDRLSFRFALMVDCKPRIFGKEGRWTPPPCFLR